MIVRSARRKTRRNARLLTLAVGLSLGLAVSTTIGNSAHAAEVPTVGLGTASSFGVLGGSAVTNTGPTVISGLSVGLSPGPKITGFPPGIITAPGVKHVTDAVALDAQAAVTTAYNDAAGRSPAPADSGLSELTGKTLQPGVYQGGALHLTGTVTLDNRTNPNAVFIFQAASTLITGSGSEVKFTTDHVSCNVFWQVTSSATLGTGSKFVGTVLALTSISATTGAAIRGRLFARNGAVTLDNNTISVPPCAVAPPTTATSSITATTSRSRSTRTPTNPNQSPITSTASRVTISSQVTSRSTASSRTNALTVSSHSTTPTTTSPGLAVTGRDVGSPLLVGILSVLAGSGVILVATRRRRVDGQHEPGSS